MPVASAELLLLMMPVAAVTSILLGRQQQRLGVLKRETATLGRAVVDLHCVFERVPLGLAVLDGDLRFVRINQLLADMNGAAIEEHIGKTIRDMVPEIADTAEPRLRDVLRTGLPRSGHTFDGATMAQPGVMRRWRESIYPLLDRDGKPQGVIVTVEEITEQQRLDNALRLSLQREQGRNRELDCLLQAAPTGLVIASDRACQRVRANQAAEHLLRLGRGQSASLSAPGTPAYAVYADGQALAADDLPLQRAAASGAATWGAQLTVRFPSGDEMRVVVNAVPLRDEQGELVGAVAGFVDAGGVAGFRDSAPLASGLAVS